MNPMETMRSAISAAVMDDGAVLLDRDSHEVYVLNAPGWAIVQLFEASASIDQVMRQTRGWGAADDGSVRAFVERLRAYDLLERTPELHGAPEVEFAEPWSCPTVERQAEAIPINESSRAR